MAKYRLRRIELYVPYYDTNATITIDERHPSGTPHLVVNYEKGGHENAKEFASAIPPDWTDQDLAEVVTVPTKPPSGRDWPSWEVPAADYASFSLFRWWKGEKPPQG